MWSIGSKLDQLQIRVPTVVNLILISCKIAHYTWLSYTHSRSWKSKSMEFECFEWKKRSTLCHKNYHLVLNSNWLKITEKGPTTESQAYCCQRKIYYFLHIHETSCNWLTRSFPKKSWFTKWKMYKTERGITPCYYRYKKVTTLMTFNCISCSISLILR